jgi:histidine phosphotransferase ChpT
MNSIDEIGLAEMLCARLCHDMAGAVGAAAAGAELLADDFDAETARMVAESTAGAVARLKFFRAALGPAGSSQPAGTLRDLASAYLKAAAPGGRMGLSLRWQCEAREELGGELGRLLLNLVLRARESLPRGGVVSVTLGGGDARVSVEFEGEGGGLGAEAFSCLVEGRFPDGPRGAQAWLSRRLAEAVAGRLQYSAIPGGGRIRA